MNTPALLTRRTALAGTLAFLGAPLRAQNATWESVIQAAGALEQLHSLTIYQDGAPVVEVVFRGPPIGQPVPIKSVSKTIVAALTGAALETGEVPSLSATLGSLAPQLIPTGADPQVANITIANLITMQAGLERTSGANYGAWVSSANWVADALSRPFVASPGERMLYSTGSFHVLGAVLSEVSGKSLLSLARERLGGPLGIEVPAWTRDPQGRHQGGNEMALTRDGMIRFGEMYRNDGLFAGEQVLSAEWVEGSFKPRTRSPFSGLDYGYGWFLGDSDGVRFALARGYGGQLICVVPEPALTIAITSDPTRPARSAGYFGNLMTLINQHILPAARSI